MRELGTTSEFLQWVEEVDKIYLYGAGNICDKIIKIMCELGKDYKIQEILVTNELVNKPNIHGIDVKEFKKKEVNFNIPILIAVSEIYRQDICNLLFNNNFDEKKIVILSDQFEKELTESLFDCKISNLVKKITEVAQEKCNDEKKDIMFVSPPYWDVYSPFSAVPCLVAKLVEEGFSCSQYDIGIKCIHNLLKNNWGNGIKYVTSKNYYDKRVKIYQKNCYNNLEEYIEGVSFLKKGYESLKEIKENYVNYNPVQKRVLDTFYDYIYVSDISNIDFDECKNIEKCLKYSDITNLIETLNQQEVLNMFRNIPDVVGLSITSVCQFIPGCILAKVIKMCFPHVKIILGGSCADLFFKSSYPQKTDIKKYFDYIVLGEGETALVGLLKCFKGEEKLENVPNIICWNPDGTASVKTQIVEDVNCLPAPCYDGLDLDMYLAPRLILPYQTSRGCHYGYCAFCNHDEKYRHNYRTKDMKKVVQELLFMSKRYNTNYFQFVDEAIRPDCFELMINEMDKYDEFKEMKWIFYSRVSRLYTAEMLEKARKNGCEMVMFGVETMNQRLLNFIRKGITADTSKYCLELFHNSGIKTYAWLMCNLPSETIEEAEQDLRDIQAMQDSIDAFYVGPFSLSKNTDMYEKPEKYNIVNRDVKDSLRFDSHNEGRIIDKERMLAFYRNEYLQYQQRCCSSANRYTIFFEKNM